MSKDQNKNRSGLKHKRMFKNGRRQNPLNKPLSAKDCENKKK
jgi:hypothetical protein